MISPCASAAPVLRAPDNPFSSVFFTTVTSGTAAVSRS